jgi:hypothetical protein
VSQDYWANAPPAIMERVEDAWNQLESVGFEFDLGFQFGWLKAAQAFNSSTLWQVFALGQILEREQPITVRGAFYRAVSAGLYPDTADKHYRACKTRILDLRRAGLVPYNYISDSTRRRLKPSSWSGLADFAQTVAQAYRKNLWEAQCDYLEVFVEKDAMAGVIEPITDTFDVTLNVIRGNCSETFVYRVAELWKQISKPITVYYLGDHDPNGMRIEQDLERRLLGFGAIVASWERLAITEEDFSNADLIGFPVKRKGPPAAWQPYLSEYGDRCVEVDAIPAGEIRARLQEAILSHIDQHQWETLQLIEAEEKKDLFAKIRMLEAETAG